MRRRTASRLLLEIDIGERLPVGVAHNEAGVGLFDVAWWREAARRFGHGALRGTHGPDCGSFLRHPGLAHPVIDTFALSKKGRVIARCASTETRDREGRINRQPRLDRSPRLIELSEMT